MSHRSASFKHSPLNNPSAQIRLLRSLNGEEYTGLQLEILPVTLCEALKYRAISYTWGDGQMTKALEINGKELLVGENCYYALWQFRLHYPDDFVWIDAICIDQNNLSEKSVQVQMMGHIYAGAVGVVSCVGPHAEDSETLVATMREMLEKYPSDRHTHMRYTEFYECVSYLRAEEDFESRNEDERIRLRQAYTSFASRAYWGRLWIVQEAAKAKTLQVLCGHDNFPWQAVVLFDDMIRYTPPLEPRRSPSHLDLAMKEWPTGIMRLSSVTGDVKMQISAILSKFSEFSCSDTRDRIYGLLGIADWVPPILPDYTRTCCDLAIGVAGRLGLRAVKDTLVTLKLTAADPEIQDMVQQRRCAIKVGACKPPTEHGCLNDVKSDSDNMYQFTIGRLPRDRGDNLTAPLVLQREEHDIPISQPAVQLSLANAPQILHPILDDRAARYITVDGTLAGLACADARAGDFIFPCVSGNTRISFLVLRKIRRDGFEVIGQAISLNGYGLESLLITESQRHHWKPCPSFGDCEQALSLAKVWFSLSAEDLVALVSQDTTMSATTSTILYLQRVITRVSMTPNAIVRVRSMDCYHPNPT